MEIFTLMVAFSAIAVIWKAISIFVREKLRASLTALDDIPLLGIPRKDRLKIRGTAVVCGGSIAGLFSARVCSDHFENVVVVEPEESATTVEGLNDDDEKAPFVLRKRSRVPQYTAFHGYQLFMTLGLRKMFSNFENELAKAGSRLVSGDLRPHSSGIPFAPQRDKYTANSPGLVNLTRAGLETLLRRLVLVSCSNVKYMPGSATALIRSESSADAVDSVRIRSPVGDESTLAAALVIDCTGPALGGLRWLQNLLPPSSTKSLEALKLTYDHKMAYTTCTFEVPPKLLPSLDALGLPEKFETAGYLYVCFANPKLDNRNVIIARKGKGSVLFCIGGWDARNRITTTEDIKSFLSQLVLSRPIPDWIHQMLDLLDQECILPTCVYSRCPPSVYVQYHLASLPSNFIAIGDSVLQLNPLRGQGCTKACVEAVTLNALLTKCASTPDSDTNGTRSFIPKDFSRTFFRLQAKRTGPLWNAYKSQDYAWETTTPARGEDLQRTRAWQRAYAFALAQLVTKDEEASGMWWRTFHWLAPSTDLLSPKIILKLAWMRLQGGVRL